MLRGMQIAADTHVHIYPFYDLRVQLDSAIANLRRAAPRADVYALCLTERAGQSAFQALQQGDLRADGWTLSPTQDPDALLARAESGQLYLFAGHQIVTAERIEVLALGTHVQQADGAPLEATLLSVSEAGAVVALPWGLGKWLGRRGRLVQNVLDTEPTTRLVFADTCLRPAWFPTPALLSKARSRGFSILYGTDPLPRHGEEKITGQWATLWEAAWDPAHPAAAWRHIVRDRIPGTPAGRRRNTVEALSRLR